MKKRNLQKIIEYAKKSMGTCNNVSISLPPLTDTDLKELRKYFTRVTPQFFYGYVKFEQEVA